MALHDRQAKIERGYTCKHSIVYADGREWLTSGDWKRRVAQLWARCEKRCERVKYSDFTNRMERCRYTFSEISDMHPHHIIKRSTQHDDRLENLMALCYRCHSESHPEKNKLSWKGTK